MTIKKAIEKLKELEAKGYGDYEMEMICDYFPDPMGNCPLDERIFDPSTCEIKIDDERKTIEFHD